MIAPGVEIMVAGLICLSPEPLERLEDVAANNSPRVTAVYQRELARLPKCGLVGKPVPVEPGEPHDTMGVHGTDYTILGVTSPATGERLYILVPENASLGPEI